MRILLAIALSFFFTVTCLAQQDSGFTNKVEAKNLTVNGIKEGKWVEYFDVYGNVGIDTISSYKRGTIDTILNTIRFGDEKGNDTTMVMGPFYRLCTYKTGELIGVAREYYRNGRLFSETHYLNGKENGVKRTYHYTTRKVWGEIPYKNGKENGLEKIYYDNGKLMFENLYVNDSLVATKHYYRDQ